MKKMYRAFALVTLTVGFFYLHAQVDYNTQIQPIFTANCTGCHGGTAGVVLTSYDNVLNSNGTSCVSPFIIVPGNSAASSLATKIDAGLPNCGGGNMPPGGPLPPAQIALIRQWIDEGAAPSDPGAGTYYANFVQPVFTANCIGCHGGTAGVFLTNEANVLASIGTGCGQTVIIGDAANSPLISKISLDPAIPACSGNKMPPPAGGVVTNAQVNAIAQWINNLITLPVEIVNFDAEYNEDARQVDLNWEVSQELEGNTFTIERTRDGIHYEAIGSVETNTNGYPALQFAYADQDPLHGKTYYRLMQTDVNGAVTHSPVVEVFVSNTLQAISLYPNPTSGQFNLEIFAQDTEMMNVKITSLIGQEVYSKSLEIQAGANIEKVEASNWPAGIYLVRVYSAGTLNRTMKLMVE